MIKPSDTVEELIEAYPGINSFLMERGIFCIKCGEPIWATLEEMIKEKGLDVSETVDELNEHFTKTN